MDGSSGWMRIGIDWNGCDCRGYGSGMEAVVDPIHMELNKRGDR